MSAESEAEQGDSGVIIEDVTNNLDAHTDLENAHHHDIVEPDPDSQAMVKT